MHAPEVTFIIVSYNTRELLAACLASVLEHTHGVSYEIVVVDNASKDGSREMVSARFPRVKLVASEENLGFGRANNLGFEHSVGRFLILLNSDALLMNDAADHLVRFLRNRDRAGIAGPGVILMDGSRQPKTVGMLPSVRTMLNQNLLLSSLFPRSRFFAGLYVEHLPLTPVQVGWVSGVCMAIRREAYARVAGFDPTIFMYAEDVDLCRRAAEAGWETWRLNETQVRHLCGGSTKSDEQVLRNRVLQQRNFLRLLDRSMGPLGRLATRLTYGVGLSTRATLRLASYVNGKKAAQLACRADFRCFVDLLKTGAGPREAL